MLNKQLILDDVVPFLRKQGHPCLGEDKLCRYVNGEDRCAIGCILDESKYDPKWETESPNYLMEFVDFKYGVYDYANDDKFLEDLRLCHDTAQRDENFVVSFEKNIDILCEQYKLRKP